MIDLQLFRIQVFLPQQRTIYELEPVPGTRVRVSSIRPPRELETLALDADTASTSKLNSLHSGADALNEIAEDALRQSLLVSMLNEARDSLGVRAWHIGNFQQLDDKGLYFRFGRERIIAGSKFEGERFVDQPLETAPSTHVLLDLQLEVVAVAPERDLAGTTKKIARNLQRLFAQTPLLNDSN